MSADNLVNSRIADLLWKLQSLANPKMKCYYILPKPQGESCSTQDTLCNLKQLFSKKNVAFIREMTKQKHTYYLLSFHGIVLKSGLKLADLRIEGVECQSPHHRIGIGSNRNFVKTKTRKPFLGRWIYKYSWPNDIMLT